MMRVAFAASLESEEQRPVAFTLFFTRGRDCINFTFKEPLPFDPGAIVRLAPALDPAKTSIAVMEDPDENLGIVGLYHTTMHLGFLTIQAISPGVLVLKYGSDLVLTYRRGHFAPYPGTPVAENTTFEVLKLPQPNHSDASRVQHATDCRLQIVREMLRIGHGGTLLLVPKEAEWKRHVSTVRYEPASPEPRVTVREEKSFRSWNQKLRAVTFLNAQHESQAAFAPSAVLGLARSLASSHERGPLAAELESVARLSATDGMVVISAELVLLAFGVFFAVPETIVHRIALIDPYEREQQQVTELRKLGGARHQSAAAAAMAVPGALAVVASADGALTAMRLDGDTLKVHKHLELVLPEWPIYS